MKLNKYLASLIRNDTGNSSKSFALVMSTIMSFIVAMVMCGILVYDVYCNGYIKTNLEDAGIFMLCVGSCVAASGVPKIFGERARKKESFQQEIEEEEEIIDP
jgi:hypothetical protein